MDWRGLVAAVCWTAVAALLVTRLTTKHEEVTVCVIALGQVALLFTGWHILEHLITKAKVEVMEEIRAVVGEAEDQAVERIALRLTAAIRESRQPSKVTSLR